MIVVTSGSAYLDIDAYAGCIAFAQLLNLQGLAAKAISNAPLNQSISQTLREWPVALDAHDATEHDHFVMIDISDPSHFDTCVDAQSVVEVIDHHPGFESYWQERLGPRAAIEAVGAACTQVYERWVEAGLFHAMNPGTAALLASAILDNTLNLKGQITTARDQQAYAALADEAGLAQDWPARYFSECQTAIEHDLPAAINKDLKRMDAQLPLPRVIGQLTVWNTQHLLQTQRATLVSTLQAHDPDWLLNLISIEEHCSYLLVGSPASAAHLAELLDVTFVEQLAKVPGALLRKQILRAALKFADKPLSKRSTISRK